MKKNYCLFLLLLVATSLTVCAQTASKFPALRAFSQQKAGDMMKVSPNAEKEKGVVMYATTLSDYFNQERGWYTFRSKEPQNATKIKTWNPGSQSNVDGLRCGCWGGDAYYAFYVLQYSLGYDYPYGFVKVKPETGDLDYVKRFESGDDLYDNWDNYMLYCMTYNPIRNEIYALGQTTRADQTQASTLYKIDKATGEPTKLHDFDFISYGMAVDMDGTLWVQNSEYEDGQNVGAKLTAFNTSNFEVKKEVKLYYDESAFKTEYYGTMSFDYTTGDLYWIASSTESYNQQLFTVDLGTGDMKSLGVFWGDFVGLYIPYTIPAVPFAPAQVIDLKATPDMTGAMKSTLTWTNPSLQWNKEQLTDLAKVYIYKKGSDDPVGKVKATGMEGQEMSWTDENATAGINTYYVVPVDIDENEGVKDSINVYVGEDAPGPVRNIAVQNNTESVTLTWDAPVIGQNEGYVNPTGLKYTVVRYPGAVEVAKDLTETQFTDTNLGQQQCFYYTIQASNSLGSGDVTESERFIAGNAYTVPVTFNFADQLYSESWTNLGDWVWSSGVQSGDERMITSSAARENNWLISPDIKLEAGKTYKVISKIKTELGPNGCTSNFKIALGKGKSAEAMTKVLREETDYSADEYYYIDTFEDFVTIDETGNYNYGIEVSSITGGDSFSLMGVTFEEVNDVDMKVTDVKDLNEAVCNENNTCKVNVYNNGSKTAEKYKVKIARVDNGSYVVLGETTDVPSIEPFTSAEVTVNYVPDVEDQIEVVGMVEIEGDQDESNNISDPYSVLVLPQGMTPFNVTITDESTLGEYTRAPMSFFVNESMSQSLYLADEINMSGTIQRIAYEYKGNDITSVLGPVSVKVYMCNTDKDIYSSENDGIAIEDMQQVYEGEVTINPGSNVMSFILPEGFEYDSTKNLCVAVVKTGLVGNSYPALFKVFNSNQFDITRTIVNDGSLIADWDVPVIKLAIKNEITEDIQNINIGAPSVWYDSSSSTLNFNEANVKSVSVYDISGKMVSRFNLTGTETSVPVNLPAGLYIVHTMAVDGSISNVKINVNK